MRLAVLCALLVASCNRKDPQPDNDDRDISGPVSSAIETPSPAPPPTNPDPPPAATPRAPLPPLPDPLPGKRQDVTKAVGAAWRAAIGNFDGDKDNELVVVDSQKLRVVEASGRELASVPIAAGIHVLEAHDVDGDGRAEILAGWGQSRDFRDAKARITVHRLQGGKLVEETIVAPETERPEVVVIAPQPDKSLLVGYYDSKFMVTSAFARRTQQGWQLDKIASLRMATSYARGDFDGDGKPDLIVGRVYGDDKGIDGDAFVLAPDGSRKKLPTTRGLRSLALVGKDLFVGDGWHQNYGEHGRGLLTWIRTAKDGPRSELIEDTAGQYALEKILPATIGGKPALVTHGSHYVRAFVRDGDRWRGLTIAGAAKDVVVGDLDGKPGDEVLVVHDKSELVDLRDTRWQ